MIPIAGAILDRSSTAFALFAAAIGIGAFLGRANTVLRRRSQEEVQRGTMLGGLAGMLGAVSILLIDAIAG